MLYVLYILYSHNKENVIRKIIKENTVKVLRYCIYQNYKFTKKCINGTAQFKPMLFECQLCVYIYYLESHKSHVSPVLLPLALLLLLIKANKEYSLSFLTY